MEYAMAGVVVTGLVLGSLGALRYDRGWVAAFLMTIAIAIIVHMTRDAPPPSLVQHTQEEMPNG